jgi:ArsR family transcriptional regulator
VCDIQSLIDQSQPKVSRHLAELRTASLLTADKRGKWVYYRLHPNLPEWTLQILTLAQTHDEAIKIPSDTLPTIKKRC